MTITRRPRFKRAEAPKIEITQRDVEIIKSIFKYRFLRSTHIISLLNGESQQRILRRLGLLYHNGYLDRPRDQLARYQLSGSKPMVYALGNKGADLLSHQFGIPRGKIDWADKNRSLSPISLDHKLLIADVMVSFQLACKEGSNVRLIEWKEISKLVPEETRKKKNPFGWQVTIQHNNRPLPIGIIPDNIFGLHFLDKPEGRNKAYFFLEADRGTMPVTRTGLHRKQSSFYKKMVGYHNTWKQNLHTKLFGFKNFRMLTVTSSEERIDTMLKANKNFNSGQGSRIFLFAHQDAIADRNLLSFPWLNGRDKEPVRLVG